MTSQYTTVMRRRTAGMMSLLELVEDAAGLEALDEREALEGKEEPRAARAVGPPPKMAKTTSSKGRPQGSRW